MRWGGERYHNNQDRITDRRCKPPPTKGCSSAVRGLKFEVGGGGGRRDIIIIKTELQTGDANLLLIKGEMPGTILKNFVILGR